MTHLKKTRSMLAATALLCGLSPATSAMGQTYSYPAGTTRPSTIGAFGAAQQSGTTNISGGPSIQWGARPQIAGPGNGGLVPVYTPTRVVQSNGQSYLFAPLRPTARLIIDPRTGRLIPAPGPAPASAPPRPPQARNVGYGVPYTNGPCGSSTSGAVMSPCVGPANARIQLRLTRSLPAAPGALIFTATPSRYVGAALSSGLSGSGASYSAAVPPQVCISGGGTWYVYLQLSNRQDMGLIGSYTPNNCA